VVDRAFGRKIVRQMIPLTSGLQYVDKGVQHFAHVRCTWSAAPFRGWNQRLQERPLLICQVVRVWFPVHFSSLVRHLPLFKWLLRGYDGGKRVKGRKRHLVVDTEGLVLKAFVSEAHYYDGTVGVWLLPGLKKRFPRLKKLWADGTYAGTFVEQACALAIDVEITTRLSDLPGFQVIPRRWVSERTFAWLGNYRRLSKDYEYWVYTSDATIYAVMVHIMVRRLARLQAAD
jgi:transposase